MLPLLKYWLTDGCIRMGWAGNAYSSSPDDRVAEKLKTIIRTPDTRPSKAMAGNEAAVKALVEEFTLAAIYLEIMYLKKDEQDIDSYYWNLHEQNEYEARLEKESGRNLDFLFW